MCDVRGRVHEPRQLEQQNRPMDNTTSFSLLSPSWSLLHRAPRNPSPEPISFPQAALSSSPVAAVLSADACLGTASADLLHRVV